MPDARIAQYNFFEKPILNSPYEYPGKHWELDDKGQPTNQVLYHRRPADYVTPIPEVKKRRKGEKTIAMDFTEPGDTKGQVHEPTPIINGLRKLVDEWRAIPDSSKWGVTRETERLLKHWRHYDFPSIRPFFCQVEAVETLIWLTEVAPTSAKGKEVLAYLEDANRDAHEDLLRIALKLATGAGKTTVMAMIIAWQTVNAVRSKSPRFTNGFLVIAPGITIRDRLRVIQPNDPDNYYSTRNLIPQDMLPDIQRAKIVITNYHAFKLRDTMELSSGGRALLQGRGQELKTLESEGQMLQRVMPDLLGLRTIMVINDEAHHCYREKPDRSEEGDLKGDDKKQADSNREAARLWISGIEALQRKVKQLRVVDLSATPFFLSGSGYKEGTLFPWTLCNFSLMDAIECGIVKLPRVPIADNLQQDDMPMFRDLWAHVGKQLSKKGRGKAGVLDPLKLPTELKTALQALYGHYKKTFTLWSQHGLRVPPCFIVVCNNTSTSKLVYDYISGFERELEDGSVETVNGEFKLFRNYDEHNQPLPRPRTLLIDSEQLESGDALDKDFRVFAKAEIEQFRRERVERTGNLQDADKISDQELLREVMNTVGKVDRLGEQVRCVVSVSMLTEGWDANNVTHVLGVRAFGTQLLCEQVTGRALRRQSYELGEDKLFPVEYADVLGIPFDFTAKAVPAKPQPPRETIHVRALRERAEREISFPCIEGYRTELPPDKLSATFGDDHCLMLTPELIGPSITRNAGLIGEGVDLTLVHTQQVRASTLIYHLTQHLLYNYWRDAGKSPKMFLFHQLKRIVRQWLEECLSCKGGTYPAQLMYYEMADLACERINHAIIAGTRQRARVLAIPNSYNPWGSTAHVSFHTTKTDRWEPAFDRCHLNWLILDGPGWEAEFCRVAEAHPRVLAYVKNHNLGFEVPYQLAGEKHRYRPDFIVKVDDGHGEDNPLHLVVEIKGYRGEDAKAKKLTMDTLWVPGVNQLGSYGRWAFAEFCDIYEMEADFAAKVESQFDSLISSLAKG